MSMGPLQKEGIPVLVEGCVVEQVENPVGEAKSNIGPFSMSKDFLNPQNGNYITKAKKNCIRCTISELQLHH